MTLDATRLRQILEHEDRRGYINSAVFGGLDRFLVNWFGQTGAQISDRSRLKRLKQLYPKDFSYASLSPDARRKWAGDILSFVSELGKPSQISEPKTSTAPKRSRIILKPKSPKSESAASLDSSITAIKGISSALSDKFARLGVCTVRDLLYFFPNRHLDYSQVQAISMLREGAEQTTMANVWEARPMLLAGRRSTEVTLGDESGNVRAVWFNNPYVARQLHTGDRVVLSGRVKLFKGRPVFESPEWEIVEDRELVHTARLVPLYPLTSGLHQRQVRRLMKSVVDEWAGKLPEFMPADIKRRQNLLELPQAMVQAHFPDDVQLKDRARVRLAFDELFLLQLGVLAKKRQWQTDQPGVPFRIDQDLLARFIRSLPFELTLAQKRVTAEIMADLAKAQPMSRLLQGEVGSGKTVVALMALLMAVANGFQGALMAPTEILAAQHFASICRLLAVMGREEYRDDNLCRFVGITGQPLTVALLIGDVKGATKRDLKKKILSGEIDIVIGTHALIQKEVVFPKLGLVVVDEQHRFGVEQRSALRQKGFNPHMLVMTATPIPRTLALTLYGDLDLSVIDEIPPGRPEIKTKWLKPVQRESAYKFLRQQVAEKRQAYIICPLVEESEAIQARAAVAEFEHLSQEVFPDLRLGLLHGRMSATDKDEVMQAFHGYGLDILVSTPVVEVGIDVANATAMLIESADRFGLSQLHQFRGRVGRGAAQSYCMLLAENPSEVGRLRLDIIESTHDGFKLADEDLKLRGPGEFFGTRQSGLPDLRMARLSDVPILEMARSEAVKLFAKDPDLKRPEHKPLAKELARVWPQEIGEWS